jgi:5-formyltetrahydrofolate cyclo-ligase
MSDKQSIRESIWNRMKQREVTLFPGAEGRIPNFKGREDARDRLVEQSAYQEASTIKINPDSPQSPVRERAFADGKTLYMAVPKLRDEKCFLELDPADINADPGDVATIKGASTHGEPIHPSEMPPVDLIVTGAVGVDREGHRLGKGGGYSDLEFALLLEFELIESDVPIWTTVHDLQVREEPLPTDDNDISLDGFVTPEQVVHVDSPPERPAGIDWDSLPAEKVESIPILRNLSP